MARRDRSEDSASPRKRRRSRSPAGREHRSRHSDHRRARRSLSPVRRRASPTYDKYRGPENRHEGFIAGFCLDILCPNTLLCRRRRPPAWQNDISDDDIRDEAKGNPQE